MNSNVNANINNSEALSREEKEKKDMATLKVRIAGMVLGLFFAHAFIALALHYTYMDSHDYFHTSYVALYGTFMSAMIFCWHQGFA
ncbi:hypothetical protein [Kozakia baliensis]|uniref:Uncharacterized protein n=1 Tax=Kozakia baliensis TaxID=153496 RepID=A0A1D8UYQ3_9PROT|nr:hypothetical protein [Kozakia baliensis]AOX18749.1 hypothetical protein A0U89_15695 [Kozakia baliensis]GBR34872.1 hypothetical protein AA0488_2897 [Kozakia baliensis NRIC 0488]GEL64973.1 hypothetical protein KBA01_22590 [Kozakia baliensis]